MNSATHSQRNGISFLYGNDAVTIDGIDPNTTVLGWLREHRSAFGTKEGCASGDCGACTAVLTDRSADDRLTYATVNTCITPVSALDGKQLITVEQLGDQNNLHPVQSAMVNHHGSQCGFCTPGFVMSLFCMLHSDTEASRDAIIHGLSGNLCRCTGYRPIIEAGIELLLASPTDEFSKRETETISRLGALPDTDTSMTVAKANNSRSTMFAPRTLAAATRWLSEHADTHIVAGATDLGLAITQDLTHFESLLDISHIGELKKITETKSMLQLGAGASLDRVTAAMAPHYPSFAELMSRYGSPAIRTRGTVGGNLATASPIGDTGPVLLALNANLILTSANGDRTVPIDDFFLDYRKSALQPGELIRQIDVPLPSTNTHFRVYKISKRMDDDISSVCGAWNLTLSENVVTEARIAFGGMAATPARATASEQALVGKALNDDSIADAIDALSETFTPLSDARASASYRLTVAGNLFKRLLHDVQSADIPLSVASLK